MFGQVLTAAFSDDVAFEALARALRDWEPRLELDRIDQDDRLYEPDGTLYAVNLSVAPVRLAVGYRRLLIQPGDLVVVPREVGVDIDYGSRWLVLRHDGPPPPHFRERFIQAWGVEHRPAPPGSPVPGRPAPVLLESEGRHRVSYHVWDLSAEAAVEIEAHGLDVTLLIGLDGEARLERAPDLSPVPIRPGTLVAVGPGPSVRSRGEARLGCLTLATELVFQSRRPSGRSASGRGSSPEFAPAAPTPELGPAPSGRSNSEDPGGAGPQC